MDRAFPAGPSKGLIVVWSKRRVKMRRTTVEKCWLGIFPHSERINTLITEQDNCK